MPKRTKDKLTIGFVLDDGLDSSDGVQQYVLTLGKEFSDLGHDVHYLVGKTARKDIPGVRSLARNVKVRFNGNRLTIPLPASKQRIKKVLNAHNFDVLHVQMPYSPFFGAKVIRLADKKTIVAGTFHIFPYGPLARAGTRMLGFCLRRTLRRFNILLSVSVAARDFAKYSFNIETEVSPNVVDISKYSPKDVHNSESHYPVRIVYIGRLVDRKGCIQLVQAYIDCLKQPQAVESELIIAGKGPQHTLLREMVEQADLNHKVSFLGFVSESEKVKLMQSADIAIFPSYAGESFGIVLIEAMAAGSGCVVGGDNPGYRSVLGGIPGSLIDVRDSAVFARELYDLITEPSRRKRLQQAQQQIIGQYDSKLVAQNLLIAYNIAKTKKTADNN